MILKHKKLKIKKEMKRVKNVLEWVKLKLLRRLKR